MFNIVLDMLDMACLSPEREGQEEDADGSIVCRNNSALLWNFDGAYWKCQPVGNEVHIFSQVKGRWVINSRLTSLEETIEFGHCLVQTLLEQEFEHAS